VTAEHEAGPSGPGTVVLDVGGTTGALVLYVPAGLDGAEIEISLVGHPGARRTHALVRQRRAGPRVQHAAVYPGLAAGEYLIWAGPGAPAGPVTVPGGQVTSYRLAGVRDCGTAGPGTARRSRTAASRAAWPG
jgi:hypothetical protein